MISICLEVELVEWIQVVKYVPLDCFTEEIKETEGRYYQYTVIKENLKVLKTLKGS